MADTRDMGESPASVNRIRAPLALAAVQHGIPLAHADFERARQAMLREFQQILSDGLVTMPNAAAIICETRNAMRGLVVTLCDPQ